MRTGEMKNKVAHHYEVHRAAYHKFHVAALLLLLVLALTSTLAPDLVACSVGVWAVMINV